MVRFSNMLTGLKSFIDSSYEFFTDPSKVIDEIFCVPDMIDPTDSDEFYINLSEKEAI